MFVRECVFGGVEGGGKGVGDRRTDEGGYGGQWGWGWGRVDRGNRGPLRVKLVLVRPLISVDPRRSLCRLV